MDRSQGTPNNNDPSQHPYYPANDNQPYPPYATYPAAQQGPHFATGYMPQQHYHQQQFSPNTSRQPYGHIGQPPPFQQQQQFPQHQQIHQHNPGNFPHPGFSPHHPQHFSNHPVNNLYGYQSMPASVAAATQSPFGNSPVGNSAMSPGPITSPLPYPVGSPIFRNQMENNLPRQASVEVRSPSQPVLSHGSVSSQFGAQSPDTESVPSSSTPLSQMDQNFQSPGSVPLNGPSSVPSSNPRSVEPAPSPSFPPEEPLPQYPDWEDMEKWARETKTMIPGAVIEKIFAKAGVNFLDPKIGSLIALSSQFLITDIVKDAVGYAKEMSKPENVLSREALEKALQDRGAKQFPSLPPDLSSSSK